MEAVVLIPYMLGLLLLPLLAVVLCVRCRELPGSYDSTASDSLTPSSIVIKRPPTVVPWPSAPSYGPVTSYPPLSQPDLLPIPRSPQPPGGSHRMPSSRQDSDGANSVASYENEEHLSCEDNDEDEEEEYHNEGYLEVLPDSTPATGTAVPPAPVPSNPSLRDSAFSMESGEDYVNVPESKESANASLDGSREYVNVSQELPSLAGTDPAILSSQEVEDNDDDDDDDDEEEEGAPDYENLQGLN
ncbi:linker for activation of T-cells family member 1 isoform X2 [Canis lupus familiaris]|uniref:Linker for activation of T cells n=2 Tax=Canis lupus familiaris TaxID=9615 RepID=A0A8I3MMK3_CANLF|nr:linker for activation of T-cells family member 1 isoform X2 [Canis lupus dingo]XP_038389674.1 linker for activation of T-cells family member 1 isoform X2 [Canis lupus familiaris]XP_038394796.1 linker for activation of T-cells family member 1 isoform X2 [Canis lupus familiaris]XP_038523628.1 linker for activation of T-cells family member 1 isoform X2 [Canis lupus familiaris]